MTIEPIDGFLRGAGNVVGSKSSSLVPLQWNMAILAALLLFLVGLKVPFWLLLGAFSLLALVILQTVFAYHFFMNKDSLALRSESHAMSKYKINHGANGGRDSE
jgi:hypothetical protein